MIETLKPNEIFIFGSNTAGNHGGGSAYQAFKDFGAEWGVGEGLTGQTYAFPTLDENLNKRTPEELEESVFKLFECANENPDKTFLLTKVGCGIAGYPEEDMKKLFSITPKNIVKPTDWIDNPFTEDLLSTSQE